MKPIRLWKTIRAWRPSTPPPCAEELPQGLTPETASRPLEETGSMATASKPCPGPMSRDWWPDGSTDVVYEPQDFMAKLAALVPAPRVHLTRFHGVLAPAAKWRSLIVPKARASVELDLSSATV